MENNKEALINGEIRHLSSDESSKAASFHSNRIAFIWIDGKLHFNKPRDTRDHQHWVLEDFGITAEEFELLPRGYCMKDRIQLFIGSDFKPLENENLKLFDDCFLEIARAQRKAFWSYENIPVYNGVIVGKVGDVWPPLSTIKVYDAGEIILPKPLDIKIRQCDMWINQLREEKRRLVESANYCKECNSYYPKEDAGTETSTKVCTECVYQDAGYGDDDEYAEVTRLVTYDICPLCGGKSYRNSIVLKQGPSKKRWQ